MSALSIENVSIHIEQFQNFQTVPIPSSKDWATVKNRWFLCLCLIIWMLSVKVSIFGLWLLTKVIILNLEFFLRTRFCKTKFDYFWLDFQKESYCFCDLISSFWTSYFYERLVWMCSFIIYFFILLFFAFIGAHFWEI